MKKKKWKKIRKKIKDWLKVGLTSTEATEMFTDQKPERMTLVDRYARGDRSYDLGF